MMNNESRQFTISSEEGEIKVFDRLAFRKKDGTWEINGPLGRVPISPDRDVQEWVAKNLAERADSATEYFLWLNEPMARLLCMSGGISSEQAANASERTIKQFGACYECYVCHGVQFVVGEITLKLTVVISRRALGQMTLVSGGISNEGLIQVDDQIIVASC